MKNKKIIIIGSGPGGLSAGMILASKGYDVDIFEKKEYIGGRNHVFKLGEYKFDMGPTFFLMKDVLEEIFSLSGKNMHDYIEITKLDPMYRLKFKDKEFFPSTDRKKMREEIEKVFPGNIEGYNKYLRKESIKYDKLIPCLKVPYGRLIDYLSPNLLKAAPYLDAHTSLYNVLGRYFKDPDMQISFTFQAKYIGMSPWTAPGTFSIISFIEHGDGVFHVKGGLGNLSQGMAKAFEEDGGKIHVSTPVKELIIENRTVKGVILENGEKKYADHTIINADFAHAMTNIVDEKKLKKYKKKKLDKMLYSCSTFMLYLGVDKVYDNIPHHNIIFADDYKRNVGEITEEKIISQDPSFYVQNASVTDTSLAPKGKSAIYVLVPVPNNKSGIDWNKEKDSFREKILHLMEKRGKFKDISKHIEEERIITPLEWENELDVYLGATFNLGHNVMQMLYFRPHNKFEEFKNCYLTGGGTHPGSGLPTIYESGRISADIILKKDKK